MDYARLRGLRVGVVGAGASAMDSAGTALEHGAARVHLLIRRPDIPRINKGKGAGSPGFVHGHGRLPDTWKWRVRHYIHVQQVPPPRNSTLRVSRHANAFFHLGCAVIMGLNTFLFAFPGTYLCIAYVVERTSPFG